MVNEVISSILEAEAKADEIIKAAIASSKSEVAAAEEQALTLKRAAASEFKKTRDAALSGAEKAAMSEYLSSIEKGKEEAKAILSAADPKISDGAALIVRRLSE